MAERGERWVKILAFFVIAGVILWLLPKILIGLLTFFAVVFFIGFFYELWRHEAHRASKGYQN